MSLRDFNSSSDERPIVLNTDPVGNTGGLSGFHTVNPEDREPNNMPKIVGGLVVALMLGAAGAYVYSVSGHQATRQVVASNEQSPPAPAAAPQPAPMPASDSTTAATPAPMPAANTTPAPKAIKSTPVHSASVTRTTTDTGASQARMQADTQPAEQPQQQAAVAPDPVSPQVPSSSVATAGQPANPEVAPQQAQSSTPQADAAAPAQDQQTGATPAPAAPAAQPAPAPQQ